MNDEFHGKMNSQVKRLTTNFLLLEYILVPNPTSSELEE